MALATLSIDLEAQLANLQTGLDKGARLAEKNAAQIEARYNKLASAAASIGTALSGALGGALVSQMAGFFQRTVDGLDALNDLADATGASVENISALEDVALRTGTSLDTVGTSLVKFNAELAKADKGSDTARILKQIGLDAEALRNTDPAEALRQTAVALARYADDGEKARIVQALFGKSVREVAPYLKDLAEQGQLNATVTAEQARAAEDLNKQLFRLQAGATQAARELAGPLASALNEAIENFQKADDKARSLGERFEAIYAGAKNLGFGAIFGLGTQDLAPLDQAREQLAAIEGALARSDISTARRADLEKKRIGRLATINKLLAEEAGNYSNEGRNGKPSAGPLPGGKPAGAAKPAKAVAYEGLAVDPTTLAALRRLEEADTTKIAQLRLELQALIELRAEQGAGSVDEAILRLEEELARLDPLQVAAAKSRQHLNELLDATPTGQLRQVLADVEIINAEFERGQIPVEQWAEAVSAATARLPQDTAKSLDAMTEFTAQFQRNVQDTLGTTIRQTLSGDFTHIEQLWGDMLLNMASQAIAADIGNLLFGSKATGGSGGVVAGLASLFGFANGAAFSGGHVTKFADGGILNRATPFTFGGRMGVAGEAGPEGVLPLKRGRNGKLGVAADGLGGVTNNYHIAAGVGRAELMAAMQMAAQTAEANVYRRLQAQRVI